MNKRIAIQPAVNRMADARRSYKKQWNLTNRADRADFERRAYYPRVDFGETPAMKPGYRCDDEWGWYEGQSEGQNE